MCVRIAAPATASSGEPIRVTVTTLMPSGWVSGRPIGLRPAPSTIRLRLVLEGPNGEYREVMLRRVAPRASQARAIIRLVTHGVWRLSLLGWDAAPEPCAPTRRLRVI